MTLQDYHIELLHYLRQHEQRTGKVPTWAAMARKMKEPVSHVRTTCAWLMEEGYLGGDPGKKPTMVTAKGYQALGFDGAPDREREPAPVAKEQGSAVPAPTAEADRDVRVSPSAAPAPSSQKRSLTRDIANQLGIDPSKVMRLVKRMMISTKPDESDPSDEEAAVVMHVMRKYELDPIAKQIHAFRHMGKLVLMVGYDGWTTIAKRQPYFSHVEIEESDEEIPHPDPHFDGMTVPKWIRARVVERPGGRGEGPWVKARFLEWFVPRRQGKQQGPWHKQPAWRLRQKAYALAVREFYGIGLADEVDRDQLDYAADVTTQVADKTREKQQGLSEQLAAAQAEDDDFADAEDAEIDEGGDDDDSDTEREGREGQAGVAEESEVTSGGSGEAEREAAESGPPDPDEPPDWLLGGDLPEEPEDDDVRRERNLELDRKLKAEDDENLRRQGLL